MSDTEVTVAPSSTRPVATKPRRRWLQFSLRTLTIFMVGCSLLLAAFGWRLQRARKQAEAVATIRAQGGGVCYDYAMQRDSHGMYDVKPGATASPVPALLRTWLGEDFFSEVYGVYNAGESPATQSEMEASWNAIGTFPHLKVLVTSGRGWRKRGTSLSPGIKNLAKTPELQHLLIDHGRVDLQDLQVIGQLLHLQELTTWEIEFDDAALESMANLKELRMLEIQASTASLKGAVAISQLRNLEELKITSCSFGDDEAVALGSLSKLKILMFGDCRIGNRGVESLARLQELEWIGLSGGQVGDPGMDSLCKLPKLSYVHLSRTQITNASLPSLARLKSITSLSVDQTAIDDDGLAALAGFPNLTDFSIIRNPITDRGMARARFPSSLVRLSMNETRITDGGLKNLTKLASLQLLDVQGSEVTATGAAELTKSLPACLLLSAPRVPKPKQAGP